MVGAYAYTLVALVLGVSPWLALPFAFLVGAIVGLVVERLLMRPLYAGYASLGPDARRIRRHHHLRLVAAADQSGRQDRRPLCLQGPGAGRHLAHVLGPDRHQRPSTDRRASPPSASSSRSCWSCAIPIGAGKSRRWRRTGSAPRSPASTRPRRAPSSSRSPAGSPPCRVRCSPTSSIRRPDVGVFPAIKSYVIVVLGGMGSVPGQHRRQPDPRRAGELRRRLHLLSVSRHVRSGDPHHVPAVPAAGPVRREERARCDALNLRRYAAAATASRARGRRLPFSPLVAVLPVVVTQRILARRPHRLDVFRHAGDRLEFARRLHRAVLARAGDLRHDRRLRDRPARLSFRRDRRSSAFPAAIVVAGGDRVRARAASSCDCADPISR